MYSKAILVALLSSLSVSVAAIPAAKGQNAAAESCAVAKTVTVTATAAAAASSGVLAVNPNAGKGGFGGAKGGNNAGKGGNTAGTAGKGGNNAGKGGAAATSTAVTTSAAAAATSAAASTGNNAASGSAASAQTSLTLDPASIQPNYANDGNANADAGQEPSLTSTNNFINFCLQFSGVAQTNGQQVLEGSCNQTPMGIIAAQAKMPSSKFQTPANGDTIAANTNFTITMAINNLETGHFTNPTTTFHMAPQQVNAQGLIVGHSHVTIEALTSLSQTTPTDPTKFAFFKGVNGKAVNGVLSVEVAGGLPAGVYRLASINSAANHQPALVAVAQRGALDDMIYFTVSDKGAAAGAAGAAAGSAASSTAAAAASSSAAAATGKGAAAGKGAAGAAAGAKAGGRAGAKGQGKNRRSF